MGQAQAVHSNPLLENAVAQLTRPAPAILILALSRPCVPDRACSLTMEPQLERTGLLPASSSVHCLDSPQAVPQPRTHYKGRPLPKLLPKPPQPTTAALSLGVQMFLPVPSRLPNAIHLNGSAQEALARARVEGLHALQELPQDMHAKRDRIGPEQEWKADHSGKLPRRTLAKLRRGPVTSSLPLRWLAGSASQAMPPHPALALPTPESLSRRTLPVADPPKPLKWDARTHGEYQVYTPRQVHGRATSGARASHCARAPTTGRTCFLQSFQSDPTRDVGKRRPPQPTQRSSLRHEVRPEQLPVSTGKRRRSSSPPPQLLSPFQPARRRRQSWSSEESSTPAADASDGSDLSSVRAYSRHPACR